MNYTTIPDQYASMRGELVYAFSGAAGPDAVLQLHDERSGQLLGSKALYGATQGQLNLGPLVRSHFDPVPSTGSSGFYPGISRTIRAYATVDGVASAVRTFTAADRTLTPPEVATTLPLHRLIAYGESEEITCCLPVAYRIEVAGNTMMRPVSYDYTPADAVGELSVFRLDTTDLPAETTHFTVRIVADDREVTRIEYTLTPHCAGGYRLAWLSRAGSIEHYTFPVVRRRTIQVTKESFEGIAGGRRDGVIVCEEQVTLRSAYEPAAVIAALAEIVASPRVWRVEGELYEEVAVRPAEQTVQQYGSLRCVELTIVPKPKTRERWS